MDVVFSKFLMSSFVEEEAQYRGQTCVVSVTLCNTDIAHGIAFSALTLLSGRQEEHLACKNWVMSCWHGYLSGVRYRWFAYGPADGTTTPSSLVSWKSRLVWPFWCRLTQVVLEKRPLNGCLSVCDTDTHARIYIYTQSCMGITAICETNHDWPVPLLLVHPGTQQTSHIIFSTLAQSHSQASCLFSSICLQQTPI